jgi:hypothetical protein
LVSHISRELPCILWLEFAADMKRIRAPHADRFLPSGHAQGTFTTILSI